MSVTVTLQEHQIRAIVDARVKLTLLSKLGLEFGLICDALDEVVQMASENRERDPDMHSVHYSRVRFEQ